jgi:hypothetical protein
MNETSIKLTSWLWVFNFDNACAHACVRGVATIDSMTSRFWWAIIVANTTCQAQFACMGKEELSSPTYRWHAHVSCFLLTSSTDMSACCATAESTVYLYLSYYVFWEFLTCTQTLLHDTYAKKKNAFVYSERSSLGSLKQVRNNFKLSKYVRELLNNISLLMNIFIKM